MLHREDLSRVKEVWFCADEDERIERSEIVKGYEKSKDSYVVVEDEDLKKIAPPTASTMEIIQFVAESEVDAVFFETSYYVAPDANAGKPYALFSAALKQTRQFAVAKLAMHNREHVVLIRPTDEGLLLHTLFYPTELQKRNRPDLPSVKFTKQELDLAKTLINHLTAPFKPEQFQDSYRENVERLIRQKDKGKEPSVVEHPRKAPVVDLIEALKESLKSAKPRKAARRKSVKRRAA